ncbi:MAG TPA: DNA repair protein RecO C-terminal domain-containing protein [Prochlorococcaceae cyanobacterium AMR_MDS_5431]|nr:DNA repair protein RecO C-terminal domain-containing protein [Prochlorococcaceae cyanobacterium AMR_MDS_5431]
MNKPYLIGFSLRITSLGENDQLLFLLSDTKGLVRLVIPNGRKLQNQMRSILPFCFVKVYMHRTLEPMKVSHVQILYNFSAILKKLETLSAAQGLIELCMQLLSEPIIGMQEEIMLQLIRLENTIGNPDSSIETLAIAVQSSIHQLMLGGYCLPVHLCARTGQRLLPSLKDYNEEWRCSFLLHEGFVLGQCDDTCISLNASEFLLLQQLHKSMIPRLSNGQLIGSRDTWIYLLDIICLWIETHLPRRISSFEILRNCV